MFDAIVGQKQYIEAIKSAIDNNRLPHALLISGNEGTGGLALAFAAAKYLICTERNSHDACGSCPQCLQMQKLQHPDLHFVYPVVKLKDKDTVSTDYLALWREAFLADQYITLNDWVTNSSEENKQAFISVAEANNIIRELSTKPYESEYRVMIIWMPEKMREDAANKLLKIIEEPYENTHFLLVSHDPESIIGTILSRVQRINLPPIPEQDIVEALVNREGCDPQIAPTYAHMAHGSYVEARKLMNEDEERHNFLTLFTTMMRMSYARKIFNMKSWSDDMAALGREKQKAFLQYAQLQIRENYIMNFALPEINYFNNEEQAFAARFHNFVNEKNVEGIVEQLSLAEKDIAQNVNPKMVFFDLSLKLIMLLKSAQ